MRMNDPWRSRAWAHEVIAHAKELQAQSKHQGEGGPMVADDVAASPCRHNVDLDPGWSEMAFLPEEKYVVQRCIKGRGWHVLHYDEQAALTDGSLTCQDCGWSARTETDAMTHDCAHIDGGDAYDNYLSERYESLHENAHNDREDDAEEVDPWVQDELDRMD